MLAIKWRTALYTRVAFRDQGAMSSSVLSWTHHSAEGWHLLSHSHTLTIIIANNQALDPSQMLKSSVCVCEQCFDVAATKRGRERGREMLAATVLNLFLTGAEFVHPHKHHFSAPPLIYWFILYGIRIAPLIDSIHTQGFPKFTSPVILGMEVEIVFNTVFLHSPPPTF